MNLNRREFIHFALIAAAACSRNTSKKPGTDMENYYDFPMDGTIRILHTTDSHAQLLPVYFREPSINLGFGNGLNQPPHIVGKAFLKYYGIPENTEEAHVFTYLNFTEEAKKYHKIGGYEALASLIEKLRNNAGNDKVLLLDGGDSWQGSGTSLWTKGMDMVNAMNILNVDAMTGHWEYTYPEAQIRKNIEQLKGEFIAQNVFITEEASFDGAEVYDEDSGHVFKPYTIKETGGHRVCVIGQSFPYTPIANPQRFIPDWTFGIRLSELRDLIKTIQTKEKPDVIVLLSHNGMDVDLKLAANISGIDIIMGGHTHDGIPKAVPVKNSGGITYVTNGGSHGKYLGCYDIKINNGKMSDLNYRLLPVLPALLPAHTEMKQYIGSVRKPYLDKLNEKLGTSEELLYRRGNFTGTSDQLICDSLRHVLGADISLSPGFRWGSSILPGQDILMEDVMNLTGITYPETYVTEMTGANIKEIFEDVADNLFNKDPFLQQGGDMVRAGGMDYDLKPVEKIGKRLSNMRLDNGEAIEAGKKYKVAGWSTVGSISDGPPVWEVVSEYVRNQKVIKFKKVNRPKLIGVTNNEGMADE